MTRVENLEVLIRHHKAMYYQGRPEINDFEYDKIENELRVADPNNLVLKVVGSTTTGRKVKHDRKMLSLNKTYKEIDLEKWISGKEVVSTFKIDGVSCSIVYKDGLLELGKTRGDGTFGENITEKLLWVESIPSQLKGHKEKLEVRGELFCSEENFFKLSEEMEKIELEKPTSQRNIVAGLVSRKENIELCRYIEFRAFDVLSDTLNIKSEKNKESFLEGLGFIPEKFTLHKNMKTVTKELLKASLFMSEGSYQIDGLVFTYNDYLLHDELGSTAHHPRYKMAFKYAGDTKKTVINKIVWSVSRNGILTPVADVKAVELSGATIERVTLHNYGMVKLNNLKSGDEIEIVRSGEVIPKFLQVISDGKGRFGIPKNCPSCNSKTEVVEIRLFCTNENCSGKVKESILNFIQKIGIEDLSSKRLDEMMAKEIVRSVTDLFLIKQGDLLGLNKFKEKLEAKLLINIDNSKKSTLVTFLSALGIKGGAISKCERVVLAGYNNIEKILNLKLEDLTSIDGFAEKSSHDFLKSLQSKHKLIKSLLKVGFTFEELESVTSDGLLSGKKVAITGSLSEKRSIVEAKVKGAGGIIVTSVTKKTDILLTNQQTSSSSKFKKAVELGIEVISEKDLEKYT